MSEKVGSSGKDTIAMAAGVGTVKAGENGCIATAWWDGNRYRALAGNIGETKDRDGNVLTPDTWYRIENGCRSPQRSDGATDSTRLRSASHPQRKG